MVNLDKMDMFDLAFELGADTNVLNKRNLTPLTMAADLARTEMFFHILNLERQIYWHIGN